MRRSSVIIGWVILILLALFVAIWLAVVTEERGDTLTVSFFDIGQGDAIFIDAPSGRQVLIDGGASRSVLRELATVMPWYDRSIDIVVGTHPDADHVGGLIDVLARYKVSTIVESSVLGETPLWDSFQKSVERESKSGAKLVIAERGQVIDLGPSTGSGQGMHAYLEILFPDREVPGVETNTGCVITKLVYGDTGFLLPCDAPAAIEKYLVALDGANLHANVLKAAHHGSKTSSTFSFVGFVDPEYAIYSRGCDNSYGHPHENTIATFAKFGVPTLDTCEEGTITFVSDGKTVSLK